MPRSTSRKAKTRSIFFVAFLKFTLNLEYFEKIYQSHTLSINEIIKCEKGSYLNVQSQYFMQRFGRQQVNGSQTLPTAGQNQFHTPSPLT